MHLTRRHLLATATLAPFFCTTASRAATKPLAIHVHKGLGCGCCTAWSKILQENGFIVTEDEIHPAELARLKNEKGIPAKLASCHTAEIENYLVEGHVPHQDIARLVSEKPDALGLVVPAMPYGSQGMGPESEREAYDVLLLKKDGSTEVFSSYARGKDA